MGRIGLIVAALCLLGVADGVYLTSVHLEGVPLVCSASGTVDCGAVLHSSYAEVAGIPVSAFGIVWFAVMGVLAFRPLSLLTLVWAGVGVITVIWLVYVELVRLDKICLWCSFAHVLVLAILALVLVAATRRPPVEASYSS